MYPFGRREQVLTATWTASRGVEVTYSDLPDPWLSALDRLSHDLLVSMADLVQNEVADVGTAWLWGNEGRFHELWAHR